MANTITDATAIQALFETMFGGRPLARYIPPALPQKGVTFDALPDQLPGSLWDTVLAPAWGALSQEVARDRCGVSMWGATWAFNEVGPGRYDLTVCTEPDPVKVMMALKDAEPEFAEVDSPLTPFGQSELAAFTYKPGEVIENLQAWQESGLPIPPYRYIAHMDEFRWVSQDMVDEMAGVCSAEAMYRKAMISVRTVCDVVAQGHTRPWMLSRAIDEAAERHAPKRADG